MAHANAIFLSLLSGAALVLTLAPGCSGSSAAAEAAVVWTVEPGATNTSATCSTTIDTFSVGNTTSSPIQTAADGTKYNGVPVTVQCTVSPISTGFHVNAFLQYGNSGTLTVVGDITVSGNANPGTQTGITGEFGDELGLKANMTDKNCTVTFPGFPNQGVAATRVWGVIDCPNESDSTQAAASSCTGHAEFLFESCGQ